MRATCPSVEPCILHARLKKPALTSAAASGEKIHHNFTSCLSPIWRPLLSDTFFFCLSVGFPKFVSGRKPQRHLPQTPAGGPQSPCNNEAAQAGASDTQKHPPSVEKSQHFLFIFFFKFTPSALTHYTHVNFKHLHLCTCAAFKEQ